MSLYVENTQAGTNTTVANAASQAIALDAGVPALIYVRMETALATAEAAAATWEVQGSGDPSIEATQEVQAGLTTSKIAALVRFPALLPGSYEATAIARTGYAGGPYFVRLIVTVTAGAVAGPTDSAVPTILTSYPSLIANGLYTAAFPAIAAFPIFLQFAATNSPTEWGSVQMPTGLAIDTATGAVSGSIAGAGHYQITIWAANAAGRSASQTFPLIVTEPTPGSVAGGATAAIAIAWALPAYFIDLQFDLARRLVLSHALAVLGGAVKQGDDLQLALLPSLAGTAITADITEISLAIKLKDQPNAEPLILETETGAPIVPVDVAGHKYWPILFTLSGDLITEAFGDVNSDSELAPEPLPAVRLLACDAELRVIHDGSAYTAASFPLGILQSLHAGNP